MSLILALSDDIELILEDDSIVISGMSGTYPNANNNKELADILYNKVNPISDSASRWNMKHLELFNYVGKAPNIDRFDAQFFMVHHRLGYWMTPMSRKLLEHSFQAIYDAGLSPAHLNGKKVGVFIGCSFSETEKDIFTKKSLHLGAGVLGASKAMYANRISYWLNTKGPSLTIDSADSSSTTALELACAALRRGECEAAIVGGSYLCLHPHAVIHQGRFAMISKDGKTKSFAENANGCVLADAINVIFIQKAKDALRNYAQIIHVRTNYVPSNNDATGPKYGYSGNSEITAKFIRELCNEVQLPPQAVEYVEAYGTGVPHADKCELEAIAEVYCKDRQDTLLVGSVTSNIGLSVAASGISAITKVLLGYHRGILAANLNCEQPRKDVSALDSGKLRIVTKHESFRRTYTAINGTSATGINSHVLLHGHYKPKDLSRYSTSIPYLVVLSGRQESNIKKIFENLKSRSFDAEEIALLHNIHSKNISGHLGRGYIILDIDAEKKKPISVVEKADYFNDTKRPLWFVYSGMGSQWAGMGLQLMRIPIFASAIERCQKALASKGLDIIEIICSPNKKMFDNIMHSFVGNAAIQIGLTDILFELGFTPDGIIGHSVGELGCAYADGTLTTEEMILAAYSRGRVSLDTEVIRGAMAAVGLGYEEVSAICPAEIDVACRNSLQSSTISGPADAIQHFVSQLKAKGIFVKEVACSNIAYHSRYIADAGPALLKDLQEVIKNPKTRSERWVSTSVPQDQWNEPTARYSSAEYHTNNLLNPVLFEETCRLIPHNAVLVEIAPHGLLQAILKRSMPMDCRNISLTRRGSPDNAVNLLQAIGNIYMEGYAVKLQALYPPVQFPVSTETPMLSHLVEWIHSETCNVSTFKLHERKAAAICRFVKSIHDNEYKYLQGHVIRNKMCYPFAAALVAVWDMFAMYKHLPKRRTSIVFQDVYLHAQPLLFDQKPLKLNVFLYHSNARFEVTAKHTKVISGFIIESNGDRHIYENDVPIKNKELELTANDIYQLLNERGCKYSGEFQSIAWACASLNEAALVWADNWVTFIDGILQLNLLQQPSHVTSISTYINCLCIDVNQHTNNHIQHLNGRNVMLADVSNDWTRCGGVLLEHIRYHNLLPVSRGLQKLELSVASFEDGNFNEIESQPNLKSETVTLQIEEIGKLDSLHWVPSPYTDNSGVAVTVHFAGLDLFDVKRASGIAVSEYNAYGMDYGGVTKNGERVMGVVSSGAASSQIDAEPLLLWPVPAHWSLEEAATVPFAYAHAFYALVIKGNIEPGMTILVTEGSDALGQAALAIAFAFECQVFTTVSNNAQKRFLLKRFPQLQEQFIANTNDPSFADVIVQATVGKGCNIVIACTKGVLKDAAMRCCSFKGVVIDTVRIQDRENYKYGMYHLDNVTSYLPIDIHSIFTCREDMKMLQELLSAGIVAGYVVPLTRVTYVPCHAPRAFKLLQKGRHYGCVLLRLHDSALQTTLYKHRNTCDPHKHQILFWNNEVFGIQTAETLIRQGAKKLNICCNKISTYQLLKFRSWAKLGVELEVFNEDQSMISQEVNDLLPTKVLIDALSLGSIEGIYVIIANTDSSEKLIDFASALNKLDHMSRTLCHQLKHFIIISTIKELGEKVCLSRVKSGLTATWLDLSNINNRNGIADVDVVNAIECAQNNNKGSLVAQIKGINQQPQLFNEVIALAGVNITQHGGMNVTLEELGMEDKNSSSICSFLNIMYNLSLEEWQVPLLTLEKIHTLQNYVQDSVVPLNVRGLSVFISNIYPDELLATMDLVMLSTLSHKINSVEYDYYIPGQYLCIIPGIEGHHERFRQLCKRLKLPAVVLQPGLDHPYETVKESAQRYAEILSNKLKVHDKFYILGYESGAMIAVELAAILEDKGSTGTVFCLGHTPNEFQAVVKDQLSEFVTEEQLQDAVLRHVSELICGSITAELDVSLSATCSWAEKVDVCTRKLVERATHSMQYIRALLEATLAWLERARCASPFLRTLRSKLVVLRAASPNALQVPPQLLSNQPVALHQLNLPLSCVARDIQCTTLINQYLDDDIQQEFDNKNLCDLYDSHIEM